MKNRQTTEELWDLYTEDRVKTKETHRRGDAMREGTYHLAVHVCIFNSKNQLLIQQRQPFKEGWPNMWDVTVGGSAIAGDSSRQAAEREVFEELGLQLDLSDMRPFFTMNFPGGFDDYYIVYQDVDLDSLRLQKEEVRQVRWADKAEVVKMQAQGIMIPYWFLDRLFDIRGRYDERGERIHKIRTRMAGLQHLESCISFAEIIRKDFPGMDSKEAQNSCCDTIISHMKEQNAVCAADGNMIVGLLLFSEKERKINFLAVHPEYRRQKIASEMLQLMLSKLPDSRMVTVDTFREGDGMGEAARKFYESLGFIPSGMGFYKNYPVQTFVLKLVEKD